MQQHKIVEDYLDNIVPQKIPKKIKAEIRAEMESHIYDKADFYIEIGYDEETAFQKAIEQMGETESVQANFNVLYTDSTLKAVILFFGICAWNLFSISFGLGYMNIIDPILYSLPSIAFLSVFLAGFVLLTVYTIKCCRQRLEKQLLGIISAFVLISLGSLLGTSGIFFPIINAGKLIFRYITNTPGFQSDLDIFIINIIAVILYTIIAFIAFNKSKGFRKKPYRLSLKQITVLLSVICLCFLTVYGFAFAKYEYSFFNEDAYVESPEENYLSNITSEQRDLYSAIKGGDDATETEKMLFSKGFVKETRNYEDFVNDKLLPYDTDEHLEKCKENMKDSEYAIYCYTNGMEDDDDYDDVISCIIISYDSKNKINYKLFIPDAKGRLLHVQYLNYHCGEETQEWFDNLQKGENCKSALEFIRKTSSYIIEDEKYENENTVNTYMIDMCCYYPLDVIFIDFLFNVPPEQVDYSYDFELQAENGVITNIKSI